jgi:hypothetical protein
LRTARNADLFSLKVGRETDRDELRLAFFLLVVQMSWSYP